MGLIKTSGIVLRTTKYGETSLIATILTAEWGKISAIANNVRQSRSRMLGGLQLFAFSEIVMYQARSKNGLYRIDEMNVMESFGGLRTDLDKMAYASYFAEITMSAAAEDSPEDELLRLLLNTLYALDKELWDREKIKAVFEWRTAAISGYSPRLFSCGVCDAKEKLGLFLQEGTTLCESCGKDKQGFAKLTLSMQKILDYIMNAEPKKIFSFDAKPEVMEYLSQIGEMYISLQLEKEFKTLDYLKKVRALGDKSHAE